MKKLISKVILLFAIAISFSAVANAQIYVKIRPTHKVVVARPVAPSPTHIWVNGEWVVTNGQYGYREGYWDRPKAGYSAWVDGHWRHTKRGWVWVPGHWR